MIFIVTACEFQKLNENEIKETTSTKFEKAILLLSSIDSFDSTFISLDRFDLNTVQIENKDPFIYGDQYFGNKRDFMNESTIVVFANGLVKINGELQILKRVSNEKSFTDYWINDNYLIQNVGNTFKGIRQLIIYDLKKKKRCSELFYFRWYCEA